MKHTEICRLGRTAEWYRMDSLHAVHSW